ncbi:ABC transporter substrate-binding protein [Paenibacillus alkalitolerans]|uniref:ABC transporter substrate-binding protein n=1 Tax=Paenibacillus alkalitolerans TaxID=2799335 RepID=UPI0018F60DFA|nr:ABC transporter substrate-binding protein [Paenibacillus alkalitolerans]
MHLEMHYLNLCDRLGAVDLGRAVPVTVENLSEIFECTERNAKMILRKMEEQRWIDWQPGRGRGNKSNITLLSDREQRLMDLAKRHVGQGDVREAMQLVQLRGRNNEVITRFSEWLTDFFGYRKEGMSDRQLETLRVPVNYFIGTSDPAQIYFAGDGHLVRQIFDTLAGYDYTNETLVPKLAHHWESNDARTEWTFYLRKGVLFHHRREMDAEDVVFTFGRLRNHHIYFNIKHVAALDSKTVKFELHEPCVWFPRMAGFDSTSILPKELVLEKGEAFFDLPIGTGPFQMVKRTPALYVLDAFPLYYSGRAHLDRVELHTMPSPEDDIAYWDLSDKCSGPEHAMCSWERIRTSLACFRLLTFNFQRPGPQLHPSFRAALHRILDREAMLAQYADDRYSISYGFSPACEAAAASASVHSRSDEERSIGDLLKESGYDGSPLILELTKNQASDAELIRSLCEAYGIDVKIRLREKSEYCGRSDMTDAHMTLKNVILEDEELTFLDLVFSEKSCIDFHLLDDETKQIGRRYVRNMFREQSSEGRWAWIAKLSELLRESHHMLFLFKLHFESYYNPRIGGVQLNSLGLIDFRNLWFKA